MAAEVEVQLPSAEVADTVLAAAEGLGYGRRDLAALFQVLQGVERRSDA